MKLEQLTRLVSDKCYMCYFVEKKSFDRSPICTRCKSEKYVERVFLERSINGKAYNGTKEALFTSLSKGNIVKPSRKRQHNKLTGYQATKEDLSDTCSICLGDFELGDEIHKTTCSHKFHSKCLEVWCQQKPKCPTCMTDITINFTDDSTTVSK